MFVCVFIVLSGRTVKLASSRVQDLRDVKKKTLLSKEDYTGDDLNELQCLPFTLKFLGETGTNLSAYQSLLVLGRLPPGIIGPFQESLPSLFNPLTSKGLSVLKSYISF